MAEGVTTRLQKEVNQLQKDMEKVESKLDGMAEMLRMEIRMEILKGIEGLRTELSKHSQGTGSPLGEVVSGQPTTGIVEMGSPANQPRNTVGSSVVEGGSTKEKQTLPQGLESQSTFWDPMKVNARRSHLECPRFDGVDFLGWKMKVEQFFAAVGIAEEEKVQTVMIHLDGKALQWHQRFMKSKGSLQAVDWTSYMVEMRDRFGENEYSDPMAELVLPGWMLLDLLVRDVNNSASEF